MTARDPEQAVRSPAQLLQDKAIAFLQSAPGTHVGFCTDTESYPGTVLLAIARLGHALVLRIDAKEWNGLKATEILGIDLTPAPVRNPTSEEVKKHARARTRKKV